MAPWAKHRPLGHNGRQNMRDETPLVAWRVEAENF